MVMMLNLVPEAVGTGMQIILCMDVQVEPNGFVAFACTFNSIGTYRYIHIHTYIYIYIHIHTCTQLIFH